MEHPFVPRRFGPALEHLRNAAFCSAAPLVPWLSRVRVPRRASEVALGCDKVLRHLAPGMVLVSRGSPCLGNLVVPGFWKHAGICARPRSSGADFEPSVIEATMERGVVETRLGAFLSDKCDLAVLRPTVLGGAVLRDLADEARRRVGAGYDFAFVRDDNGRYYCSKLVIECLRAVLGTQPMAWQTHWGGKGVTAHDLYEQLDCFEIVFEVHLGSRPRRRHVHRQPCSHRFI